MGPRLVSVLKTIGIISVLLIGVMILLIGILRCVYIRDRGLARLFITQVINNPTPNLICNELSAEEKDKILSLVYKLRGQRYSKIEYLDVDFGRWYIRFTFNGTKVLFTLEDNVTSFTLGSPHFSLHDLKEEK